MADSLNKLNISDQQAVTFARAVYTAVATYCSTHQSEYQAWLNQKENENDK